MDLIEFNKKLEGCKVTDQNPVDPSFHAENPSPSVKQQYVFDVQWSDCPDFVEAEVRQLWRDYGLGNDYFISKQDLDDELKESYPAIYFWLLHNKVPLGTEIWIHWWW